MPEIQVSNFVAVMEAKRAAFLASVGNITKSGKPLNASTSDVVAELKAFVSGLAHQDVADAIQGKLEAATQTAQSSFNFEQFEQALGGIREDMVNQIVPGAINQAHDKAQQMGSNQDQQTQEAILEFYGHKWLPMFHTEWNKINSFILAAANDVRSFLPSGLRQINDFFRDLSTFIDQGLS